jgi:hypothetical protein
LAVRDSTGTCVLQDDGDSDGAESSCSRNSELPERYVPAADEKLAWDQLPDSEPHRI